MVLGSKGGANTNLHFPLLRGGGVYPKDIQEDAYNHQPSCSAKEIVLLCHVDWLTGTPPEKTLWANRP